MLFYFIWHWFCTFQGPSVTDFTSIHAGYNIVQIHGEIFIFSVAQSFTDEVLRLYYSLPYCQFNILCNTQSRLGTLFHFLLRKLDVFFVHHPCTASVCSGYRSFCINPPWILWLTFVLKVCFFSLVWGLYFPFTIVCPDSYCQHPASCSLLHFFRLGLKYTINTAFLVLHLLTLPSSFFSSLSRP